MLWSCGLAYAILNRFLRRGIEILGGLGILKPIFDLFLHFKSLCRLWQQNVSATTN